MWQPEVRLCRLDLEAEIVIHEGVELAPTVPSDGGEQYLPGSWLPNSASRALSSDEFAALRAPPKDGDTGEIGVVRVPENLLRNFAENADQIWKRPEVFWQTETGRRIFSELLHGTGLRNDADLRAMRPSRRRSGLRSTTFDDAHGLRIGLHLDSWNPVPLIERQSGFNRIGLNLGTGTRFLYLVPVSIKTALSHLSDIQLMSSSEATEPHSLVSAYFAAQPWTRVLRLDVPPGYAYVAPTDALVHDGGSMLSPGHDIVLTWLGRFSFTRCERQPDQEEDH